tara:strand:- start:674 stop:934 length:261 start_codon:yes stop_codon:yes gene_type:complete
MDWMDEVLDGKPLEAEMWKVGYIESLLPYTSISAREQQEIFNNLSTLTDIEADELIPYLKENEIKRDPKDQYEQMRRNGMFDCGDS